MQTGNISSDHYDRNFCQERTSTHQPVGQKTMNSVYTAADQSEPQWQNKHVHYIMQSDLLTFIIQ